VVWWRGGVEGLGRLIGVGVDTQVSRIHEFIPRWECMIAWLVLSRCLEGVEIGGVCLVWAWQGRAHYAREA
jgi:hypothetical protein